MIYLFYFIFERERERFTYQPNLFIIALNFFWSPSFVTTYAPRLLSRRDSTTWDHFISMSVTWSPRGPIGFLSQSELSISPWILLASLSYGAHRLLWFRLVSVNLRWAAWMTRSTLFKSCLSWMAWEWRVSFNAFDRSVSSFTSLNRVSVLMISKS